MRTKRTNRLIAIAGTAGVAALVLTGCGGGGDADGGDDTTPEVSIEGDFSGTTINVVAAWSGAEQKNFEAVLAAFADATGAEVKYTSFGDNGPTYIQGQLEGGTPPNIAVTGQPALLRSLATNGDIVPLGDDAQAAVEENYSQDWIDLGSVDGSTYGVWFKGANKSTVWYNTDIYDEAGAYLRVAGGEKYDQLTNHEIPWTDDSVKQTLEALAEVWGSDVVQEGGAQRDFPTSVTEVFGAEPNAGTVFEGDFVAGNIADDGNSTVGENALFYDFPAIDGSEPAVVGGGDVAVAFDEDEATQALMAFLASPEAAEIWIPNGGLTSPNQNVDASLYPDEVSGQIAEALTGAETFRFDMSDLTPSAFGGTQGQGFWQEMISFYEDPSDVDGTMERLEKAAASAYEG